MSRLQRFDSYRRRRDEEARRRRHLTAKRALDIVICLLSAPFVVPFLLLIAAAIWVDSPGPILFVRQRTGRGGRQFTMYKFRTMVPDAEELKATYAHLNELTWPDFKITNDPRVTRVGRLLRKTSLDELPQLLSVLKGDMSLVGPRPTDFGADTYQLWQTERLDVPPGLTGLWQISGRAKVDFEDRARLDIAYARASSLLLDIKILIGTIPAVLKADGAC